MKSRSVAVHGVPQTASVADAVQAEIGGGEYDETGRLLWFGPSETSIVGKG